MEKLTREDILNYRFLSRPTYSPDGRYAAFVVTEPDGDKNSYKSNIWLLDGESTRKLTSGGDGRAFFWEDDTHILFPSDRDEGLKARREAGEKLTVYQRIDVTGGEAARAFTVPLAVSEIEKLADGKYAVTASYSAGDPDFSSLDEAGRLALAAKVKAEKDYEVFEEIPFWQDGGSYSSRVRERMYIFDPASGKAVPVTDELTEVWGLVPDGGKVYFCARRYDCKMELTAGIFVYDAASGTTECLLADGEYTIDALFVVNGKVIFYGMKWTNIYDVNFGGAIYALEDGKPVFFADEDLEPGGCPGSDCRYGGGYSAIQRNGYIYYTAAYHTGTRLVRMDAQGKSKVLIDTPDSVDCFDIAGEQNEKFIFIGMTDGEPQELYSGFDGKKLTSFNAWLRDKSVVKPERCDCAGGDIDIEGFCMKPADYEPGKKYPAVFEIHGGPKGTYGGGYFHEMQVLANAGYFVFYCNPRGGDGRGAEFADLRGKYGTIDYDDLMRFMDNVLAKYPDIDPARVGVTGGSYGGFMTNWIIGHTDRFRAAVSQRSISNWISKFGTTDIGYYFNANQNQSTPWDNVEKLWWHSPVKYADKAVTPTLFIHSEQDYRCWMAEGLQMYTALRYHGVDARLCLFHGESHGLSRGGKPQHRIRRLREMQDWFDKYLK